MLGRKTSLRGCRSLVAACVVVGEVGACAWWVSAVRVGGSDGGEARLIELQVAKVKRQASGRGGG